MNILKLLEHTKLTPSAHELFEVDGNIYLVLELIKGKTLRDYVVRVHHFSEYENLILIANNLIEAVKTIHRNGVVIRDLSPNNIIIQDDLTVKLIDLENAHIINNDRSTFRAYTPGYVNPDLIKLDRKDFSSDYYSLGAVLFFISSSLDPYYGEDSFCDVLTKSWTYLQTFKNNNILYKIGEKGLLYMGGKTGKINY